MRALAIARELCALQVRERINAADRVVLARMRASGCYVSPDVDAEIDGRAAVLQTHRAACAYFLRQIPAANDSGSAPPRAA